jgi:tetratricopeptide (TPR) repeat protein
VHFRAVLERDPRHRVALEALVELYGRLDRKEDLIQVLRRLIPLQDTAVGGKRIRIRLAELIAHTVRREEALDTARRALEVEPHTVEELERLAAVFTQLKAWMDAVRTLESGSAQLRKEGDLAGAVGAMFQVAEVWRGPANKPENAGPALEQVLELEPSNRKAWEQARELYTALNDWRSWAQVTDRYLPNLVTDDEKVQALRELGVVQETRLGAKHVAFLQYCRALQLSPSDDSTREQVERLAEETSSYDELAAVYEEVADAVPAGPLAERLFLTLATVQDVRLDDPEAAEQSLRRILEFDPTNEQALERLSAMFARRGRNQDYILSLEQSLEAAPTIERRKALLREIARVYDEQLQRPDEAGSALARALELDPDLETALVLVALQRRQGDHRGAASTLLRMRDIASTPEQRSTLQVEVAQVYERDLGDDSAAVEGYRQALEFDPTNTGALDSLERLYSKLDRAADLLAVYERQLELATDYRERVKVLFRSAAIWEERFSNLANADACVDAALSIDPQNLQAIRTLERLRRAQGRWEELVEVLDRHLHLLTDPQEQAELCVEMGDVFHQQLKAVDRAVTAYHQALELDPRCRPAMHALGTLYERSGNWPFALEMLEQEARTLGTTAEAVELWYRMGKINEDMLIDSASARRCFQEALRIDAAYLPAIRSLKGLYEAEQDWEGYERALIDEAQQTEDPQARAAAWVEVGKYAERVENRPRAVEAYEAALQLVPDGVDAARPLADLYLAQEDWGRCEQMLDIVTLALQERYQQAPEDPDVARELCRRQYRLGYVAEKNGHRDKALLAYERAWQLDATYLPVLEGYGHLLVQARRLEEALRVFQSILAHHRNDLTDLEVAEIYWTIGDLFVQGKALDRAENHFEKALAIDQAHEPSLRSMVELTEAAGAFERAGEFRQRLLQVLEGEARYVAGVALGELARTRLKDPYMALDAYLAAHRVRPEVLEVLDALYVLYRETKQGARAAEMLEKMLALPALQQDATRSKRVWFALGELNRDELGDVDKATACFNQALDVDWRFVEAFTAIEAMLGAGKKWRQLDENYKRMIGRVPKSDDTHLARMGLWRALGDLYVDVLQAPDAAVEVYKVVAAGMPDDPGVQEKYAELAQAQPGLEAQAVDAWRRALLTTENPAKATSALAELAARRKDYDSAWLAAQVASGLLGEVTPNEQEILAKLTPYARKREVAQRQLTDRLWAEHLFHPRVRGPLSEIFALLFDQTRGHSKEDPSRYGIAPRKHLVDVAAAPEFQLHQFRYVARLLGMEQVAVYSPFLMAKREQQARRTSEAAPDPMVGVEVCNTEPVALRLGGKFFGETGPRELQYLVARGLALLRPELALTQRLSAERLEVLVQAALSLSVDRFRFTADPAAMDAERKVLERLLTQQARDALARLTRQYAPQAAPGDLRSYLEGAELTATRAGAFVAGEIEPVKRLLMGEGGGTFRVPARSKIRDLMVFALGEDLHALRVAVGTSVEITQGRK